MAKPVASLEAGLEASEVPVKKREKQYGMKLNPGRHGKRSLSISVWPSTVDDINDIVERLSNKDDKDYRQKDILQMMLNDFLAKHGKAQTA